MPSPGGQTSGMAGHKNRCGWAWAGRVWYPAGLSKGYHTTAEVVDEDEDAAADVALTDTDTV